MRGTAVIAALLKSSEPSIRWKTRVHVLGEDPNARSIRSLREEIRRSPTVRALLSRRDQLGRAGMRRQVYYKWQGLTGSSRASPTSDIPKATKALGRTDHRARL